MAAINKLTAKQIVSLPVGLHSDGGNLYLSVGQADRANGSCAIASVAISVNSGWTFLARTASRLPQLVRQRKASALSFGKGSIIERHRRSDASSDVSGSDG